MFVFVMRVVGRMVEIRRNRVSFIKDVKVLIIVLVIVIKFGDVFLGRKDLKMR